MACMIPTHRDAWTSQVGDDHDSELEERQATVRRFKDLAPYFAAEGLFLYVATDEPFASAAPPALPEVKLRTDVNVDTYPYARHLLEKNEDLTFRRLYGMRVWPARDSQGREVMIRLVSGLDCKRSEELEILERLNSPSTRSDPRNHTISVLRYVKYHDLVFAVMPRWGESTVCLREDFVTVAQLLDFCQTLFEGLSFLHENRIAHRDISFGNITLNCLHNGWLTLSANEVRDPAVTRYAYIDFGASSLFPMDTDIDNVRMERVMRMGLVDTGLDEEGPSNPFFDDVWVLSFKLQRFVRVIESVVPEIGPFFDNLLSNKERPPSAASALKELHQIRLHLTDEQLQQEPPGCIWKQGRIQRRPPRMLIQQTEAPHID